MYFSLFQRLKSPRSRYLAASLLVRACFQYLFSVSSRSRRDQLSLGSLSYKGTNPKHEVCLSAPTTSKGPHVITLGVMTYTFNFGGTQTFRPQHLYNKASLFFNEQSDGFMLLLFMINVATIFLTHTYFLCMCKYFCSMDSQ